MTRWMAGVAGFAKAFGFVMLCGGPAHAETTLKACNEAFKAYQAKRGTPAACATACTGVTLGRGPAQLATCQQAVAAQAAVRPKPPRPVPAAATEDRPAPAPRRADRWRELGLVPVRIAGGSYRPGRPGATNDETPPSYDVRVATFELSKTEVTVAQYRKCVNDGPCTAPQTGKYCKAKWFNWDKPDRANHPVNCVDWHQAGKFAEWSGGRLPTEAEWEWAARGRDDARKYPWGSTDPTCAVAVMSGNGGYGCGTNATWPTCQKPGGHSRDGVCDLGGNVWEWVEDAYETSGHEGIPRDGTARIGAAGADRVVRGGSWWYDVPADFRAANRGRSTPDVRSGVLGFRVARPLP